MGLFPRLINSGAVGCRWRPLFSLGAHLSWTPLWSNRAQLGAAASLLLSAIRTASVTVIVPVNSLGNPPYNGAAFPATFVSIGRKTTVATLTRGVLGACVRLNRLPLPILLPCLLTGSLCLFPSGKETKRKSMLLLLLRLFHRSTRAERHRGLPHCPRELHLGLRRCHCRTRRPWTVSRRGSPTPKRCLRSLHLVGRSLLLSSNTLLYLRR